MLWPRPMRVALNTLMRLVRAENIGELPDVLTPAAGWQPEAEEKALDGQLREECTRLGWFDQRGRLDVDVAAALSVLCRPTIEYSGWITVGDTTAGVIVAATGRSALLAIEQDGWVSLRSVGSASLPRVLVAQTPDVGAGRGEPFRVRRADVLAFDGGQHRPHGGVAVHPVPLEVRRLHEIAALGRTGGGEFRVAVRDGVGRRHVASNTVSYVDTVVGRYVTLARMVNGEVEMFIAPADHRALVARLLEVHRSLTD
ncbi:ESX secretion-associated protein EspG [Kibdelosporangium philippinense]|uniref:ESX secretion-associated protein EspG n=1 Tax=Kibdelosporangium philippinense TaxID=211113 RepID=A0ABS8ZM00_9PSEU|nr:ESX secretion-associated protein EspG [Kibdelosporangium philippinense]MCE7008542.1 ESX secretion-associated protein EspG [Kibdelosporangium philippinense]